ncbi:MAG: DUF362 domain-containing protein [Candidatus Brocadiia bacterium]
MAATVHYAGFDAEESQESICAKTQRLFRAADLGSVLTEDGLAAVKTHFGERNNDSYVPAPFVKAVIDEVREAGARPCLVETSTLYRGQRSNAYDHFNLAMEHGFGPQEMGCPLLFLDGLKGNQHVEMPVNLKHFDTVAVAADLTLIPSVLVVTHLTGHMMAGMGGAIKNVAMGLASRAGKLRQHSAGRPEVREGKCVACGTCAEWCPEDAIEVDDVAAIDDEACIGCGECVSVCPVGAMGFSWSESAQNFNEKMAEYAFGILKDKSDRAGFITFIYRTTKDCNCESGTSEIICDDVGILASTDPVAVDQAAVDLVNEAHGGDLFGDVWPDLHPEVQLTHGEEIGLGSRDYELVTV